MCANFKTLKQQKTDETKEEKTALVEVDSRGNLPASNFLGHRFRSHAGSQQDLPLQKPKGPWGLDGFRLWRLLPRKPVSELALKKKIAAILLRSWKASLFGKIINSEQFYFRFE